MSRDTSLTFRQAINASQTVEVFLILLEISHDDLAATIRVTSDMVDTISNGETYVNYPFTLVLPGETGDELPSTELVIDNVSRVLINSIRSISTAPTVNIKIVLASDPDTVEVDFTGFELTNVTYDALTIKGDLRFKSFLNEPFPGEKFNPNEFPGMF